MHFPLWNTQKEREYFIQRLRVNAQPLLKMYWWQVVSSDYRVCEADKRSEWLQSPLNSVKLSSSWLNDEGLYFSKLS